MSDNLRKFLEALESSSVEDLRRIRHADLLRVSEILSEREFSDFMFAKNIKVFGGINNYVDDFFHKNTISKILAMSDGLGKSSYIKGCLITLNKMLKHDDLTHTNRTKITNAISQLSHNSLAGSAPAAGGRRKKSKSKRKTRRLS